MTEIIDGEFSQTKDLVPVGYNLNIDGSDLAEYVQDIRSLNGGPQILLRFPNGFGASVIQNSYSYGGSEGLWEVGVTRYRSDDPDDWMLCYDTDVTEDVVGHLIPEQVTETLRQVRALDVRGMLPRQVPPGHVIARRMSLSEEQAEISRKMGELARRMSKVSEELALLDQTYGFDEED